MRRTPLIAGPLVVLALTATACGGSGSSSAAKQSKAATVVVPAQAVRDAAGTTEKVKSSKIAFSSSASFAGRPITVTGSGAFDYATRNGSLLLQVPGLMSGAVEERVVDGVVYVQLPTVKGTYYSVKVSDLVGTSLGTSTDPASLLQALQGVSTDVTKVGPAVVRGTTTTEYKGTYDVAAALAKLSGPAKQALSQALAKTTLKKVPFEAYLDDQGRLRKFVQTFDATGPGGQKVTSTTTLELFDFGTPVTVTAPPAAQVKDGSALLGSLQAAGASS